MSRALEAAQYKVTSGCNESSWHRFSFFSLHLMCFVNGSRLRWLLPLRQGHKPTLGSLFSFTSYFFGGSLLWRAVWCGCHHGARADEMTFARRPQPLKPFKPKHFCKTHFEWGGLRMGYTHFDMARRLFALQAVVKIWLGVRDVTLAREWSSLTIIDHPRCISRPRTASKRGLTIAATKNGQKRRHSWTRYHGRGSRAKSLGKSDLVHIVSGQLATISSRALLPQLIHLFTHWSKCVQSNGYRLFSISNCYLPDKRREIIIGTNTHGWVSLSGFFLTKAHERLDYFGILWFLVILCPAGLSCNH